MHPSIGFAGRPLQGEQWDEGFRRGFHRGSIDEIFSTDESEDSARNDRVIGDGETASYTKLSPTRTVDAPRE